MSKYALVYLVAGILRVHGRFEDEVEVTEAAVEMATEHKGRKVYVVNLKEGKFTDTGTMYKWSNVGGLVVAIEVDVGAENSPILGA